MEVQGEPATGKRSATRTHRPGKRLFDVFFASLGLVVMAPVMALIALAIKIDSPGRVIFSQPRLGRHGEVFHIHKFRKFPEDWGNRGGTVTVAGDVRMTTLGRILERIKFDELPQLWNILKGEMSFVGPRPESLPLADLYEGQLADVLSYVPGIFGPNQVAYRNESEMYPLDQDPERYYRDVLFPAKAGADLAYCAKATFWTDLYWILKGLWVSLIHAIHWQRFLRLKGAHMAIDSGLIIAGWSLGNLLRFEGVPQGTYWSAYLHGLWLAPMLIVPLMLAFGVYARPVRYFCLASSVRLTLTVAAGMASVALVMMATVVRDPSLTVFVVATGCVVSLMVGGRWVYRERWRGRWDEKKDPSSPKHFNGSRGSNGVSPTFDGTGALTSRVMIYGAGRRGAGLAEFLISGFERTQVVGFMDDDSTSKRGQFIASRPVLGPERDLSSVHMRHPFDQLWLSFTPDPDKRIRLQKWCDAHEVTLAEPLKNEPFATLMAPPKYRPIDPARSALPDVATIPHHASRG